MVAVHNFGRGFLILQVGRFSDARASILRTQRCRDARGEFRSGCDVSLSDGVIEYAKTHEEIKDAFLAFRRDADHDV
jgi:hypothetical protein